MPIADEIERKYLLLRLPELPAGASSVHIEQGYLDVGDLASADDGTLPEPAFPEPDPAPLRGRIRRERRPDGSVLCTNTVKRGRGLVRQELEQEITEQQFEANWHRTAGARLTKTRHRVPHDGLIWEIDDFHELGVQVAEVELPEADCNPALPDWLAPVIDREVTEDGTYRNLMLARRSARMRT